MQAYQEYINAYQQKTSLYMLRDDNDYWGTYLHIYNTETKTKDEIKILRGLLNNTTCITQLPNGKLFCFGNGSSSGITVIMDAKGTVEMLTYGTPCYLSSCIYFNNSVYCFGGGDNFYILTLSSRFDLEQNRWIQLASMPKAGNSCNSTIFNGNILISRYENKNLLLYSIDIDSFSTIPYEFTESTRKILINAERLYLIECSGSIYESEFGSWTNWKQINKSAICHVPLQVYCAYNKGGIYIGIINIYNKPSYYKFDLNTKLISSLN